MRPRGPDDSGLEIRENAVFAHRRLAIRDADAGRQPWMADDGSCVLVYNGEIYNDDELRAHLQHRGHRFRTRCDTEVVMAAWQEWGPACVEHLCGMFALGVYDFREDLLFLARDRFGVKPLFLTCLGETLVFASSVGALLKHPDLHARPNMRAVSHYLTTFRLTLGRETLFEDVWQLLPGERLIRQHGRIRIDRYWDYPADEADMSYDEAVDLLEGHLERAVQSRLVSDVPVGMFLSGGVDSNTIACMIREPSAGRLVGQCGGGPDDRHEDFRHARACAEHAGFEFGEVRVSAEEYAECWLRMIGEQALPLATPSDVIIFRLSQQMKRSVGVVLGGEGADEILCGYSVPHWAGHDFDGARAIASGRWQFGSTAARLFQDSFEAQYGRRRFSAPVEHYFALNSLIPTRVKPSLLREHIWEQADEDRAMWDYYASRYDAVRALPTSRQHATLLHQINLESLLARLDGSTMLASLEARVPYTDHRLVEAMVRVPYHFKIDVAHRERTPHLCSAALAKRGTLESKRVLRTVAGRMMPAALAQRKKQSFPTPVEGWIAGPWQETIRRTLCDSPFGNEVFQPEALRELAETIPATGMTLWPIVNLLHWGDMQFAA